eukprot:1189994-Prorocentrum_minimum.AAC.2
MIREDGITVNRQPRPKQLTPTMRARNGVRDVQNANGRRLQTLLVAYGVASGSRIADPLG